MHVLAIDTATPAVTAGIVRLGSPGGTAATGGPARGVTVLAQRIAHDARKHCELLMPGVRAACTEAGLHLGALDAIVVGVGPGPFTGLRVGMVTAAALGDALAIPVHGVCSLDAIAAAAVADAADEGDPLPGNLLVASDARRKEIYWAGYSTRGIRLIGPAVARPEAVEPQLTRLGVAATAGPMAERFGLPVRGAGEPSPAGLVSVASGVLRSGAAPAPLEPLYLRRPDAVVPGERKRVSLERSPA